MGVGKFMEDTNKTWDNCNTLTKEELLIFLKREYWIRAPSKKEVVFFQWERRSGKILSEQQAFYDRVSPIKNELAKRIGCLGAKYYSSTDNHEKLRILKERALLFKKLTSFDAEEKRLEKRYAENEKLLNKYRSPES
jgi:hypothetical protein